MTPASYLRDRAFALAFVALAALLAGGVVAVLGQGWQAAALVAFLVSACGGVQRLPSATFARVALLERSGTASPTASGAPWYVPSLMERPDFLEGRLAFDALEAHARAAADEVAASAAEAEAYRGYVELWIHEVKTPIAAAGLMAAGLHGAQAERLRGELDRIEDCVEQALYYARSTSLTRDFSIRETALSEVVRDVAKKHARYLVERKTMPRIDVGEDVRVQADAKWLAFIVGQLVTNAAKHGASTVRFSARTEGEGTAEARTVLEVADDGPESLPRTCRACSSAGSPDATGGRSARPPAWGCTSWPSCARRWASGWRWPRRRGRGTRVLLAFPHDRRRLDAQAGAWGLTGAGGALCDERRPWRSVRGQPDENLTKP